jgi:hypothetical protein
MILTIDILLRWKHMFLTIRPTQVVLFSQLKDMGMGFDPLMCARVMIPFNIVSLGATTRSTTTSRCPHGFRLGPHGN